MELGKGRIGKARGVFYKEFFGLAVGVTLLIVGSSIVALLISEQIIDFKSSKYGIMLTLLAASFISAIISTGAGRGIWHAAISSTLGMMLALLLGNLLLGTGRIVGTLQTSILVSCGSMCVVLLKLKPQKSKAFRRKKY